MDFTLQRFESSDMDDIAELSVLAWEPVFNAWKEILGPELYPIAIFKDWRKGQADAVTTVCSDEKFTTWVATVGDRIAGFISFICHTDRLVGEVYMLAVHPEFQNDGIGTELNLLALQKFRDAGMKVAEVGTGGDDGHAPARRSYEKVGYTGLPTVRYYQKL